MEISYLSVFPDGSIVEFDYRPDDILDQTYTFVVANTKPLTTTAFKTKNDAPISGEYIISLDIRDVIYGDLHFDGLSGGVEEDILYEGAMRGRRLSHRYAIFSRFVNYIVAKFATPGVKIYLQLTTPLEGSIYPQTDFATDIDGFNNFVAEMQGCEYVKSGQLEIIMRDASVTGYNMLISHCEMPFAVDICDSPQQQIPEMTTSLFISNPGPSRIVQIDFDSAPHLRDLTIHLNKFMYDEDFDDFDAWNCEFALKNRNHRTHLDQLTVELDHVSLCNLFRALISCGITSIDNISIKFPIAYLHLTGEDGMSSSYLSIIAEYTTLSIRLCRRVYANAMPGKVLKYRAENYNPKNDIYPHDALDLAATILNNLPSTLEYLMIPDMDIGSHMDVLSASGIKEIWCRSVPVSAQNVSTLRNCTSIVYIHTTNPLYLLNGSNIPAMHPELKRINSDLKRNRRRNSTLYEKVLPRERSKYDYSGCMNDNIIDHRMPEFLRVEPQILNAPCDVVIGGKYAESTLLVIEKSYRDDARKNLAVGSLDLNIRYY